MKKLLLIITGSIAAERFEETVNEFKTDYELTIILTEGAKQFVPENILKKYDFYIDELLHEKNGSVLHVTLATTHDLVAIIPASYNFINQLANGQANRLSLLVLSAMEHHKLLLAPAMNSRMWRNPILNKNLLYLKSLNVVIVDPIVGELTSGEVAMGCQATLATIKNKLSEMELNV